MRDGHDRVAGLPEAVRALAGVLVGEVDPDAVLQRACEAATIVVPGTESASVTLDEPEAPRTAAAAGELALHADELQYGFGDGPCLEAVRTAVPVLVADLDGERRWPAYVAAVRDTGLRASISVPFPPGRATPRALNLYTTRTSFSQEVLEIAVAYAQYAAAVAAAANDWLRARTVSEQLSQAMASRATIEQAKGVVMAQQGCGPAEAFEVLVRLSQTTHVKVRDVAQAVVEQASGG